MPIDILLSSDVVKLPAKVVFCELSKLITSEPSCLIFPPTELWLLTKSRIGNIVEPEVVSILKVVSADELVALLLFPKLATPLTVKELRVPTEVIAD